MRKRSLISVNSMIAAAVVAGCLAPAVASAAPLYTPFLSVDFNDSSNSSPTLTGFNSFNVAQPAGTTSLSQTVGSYGVTISLNPVATASTLDSRDRGAQGSSPSFSDLYRDFALVNRDAGHGLGYSYLEIQIAGLTPNAAYEFTGFGLDPNSVSSAATTGNREGFSPNVPVEYTPTPNASGGSDGAASGGPYYYTPVFTAPAGEYDNSVSFNATSDANGVLTVYAFADTNSFGGQTGTIVNGFQVGLVTAPIPEPASLGMLGLGALALLARKRTA